MNTSVTVAETPPFALFQHITTSGLLNSHSISVVTLKFIHPMYNHWNKKKHFKVKDESGLSFLVTWLWQDGATKTAKRNRGSLLKTCNFLLLSFLSFYLIACSRNHSLSVVPWFTTRRCLMREPMLFSCCRPRTRWPQYQHPCPLHAPRSEQRFGHGFSPKQSFRALSACTCLMGRLTDG